MQIKYRITLVYSIIVTIILLLFCTAIYIFSYQDMVSRFKDRLLNKANSTAELYRSPDFDYQLIKIINHTFPSSLYKKSIYVLDYKNSKRFVYNDPDAQHFARSPGWCARC